MEGLREDIEAMFSVLVGCGNLGSLIVDGLHLGHLGLRGEDDEARRVRQRSEEYKRRRRLTRSKYKTGKPLGRPKSNRKAECHPDKPHYAKGKCCNCYNRAYNRARRKNES